SLIDHHRKEYNRFGWKFIQGDVVQNGINDTYDIIVSRAMLQHLYSDDVIRVLAAFSNSGSGYLLATTFPMHARNDELPSKKINRFRKLNLEIEPVSLSTPLCLQHDGPPKSTHPYLGLWRLPLKRIKKCEAAKPFSLKGTHVTLYSCSPWA
ncbi:MAG: class I SAM-dependent methyltransferase, partial [Chromatiales bacterium]